jgi:hypothetical protein
MLMDALSDSAGQAGQGRGGFPSGSDLLFPAPEPISHLEPRSTIANTMIRLFFNPKLLFFF